MPLIAMTREMGSLGKDVAAGVATRMKRKVVYHEIIEPIANKMRLRKSHVERFLDGRAGLWERLGQSTLELPFIRLLGIKPSERRIPWSEMDLADPDHPKVTIEGRK